MDQWTISQGGALPIAVTVRDGGGDPITTFTGSEALQSVLWPGGNYPTSCQPATSWTDPSQGLVAVLLDSASTAALTPGRYSLRTLLSDGGQTYPAYDAAVVVQAAAGAVALPTTYCGYEDLLTYARGWLSRVETGDDGAGFVAARGRARSWIEDCAHAHYRVASLCMVVGGQSFGPRRSGSRSAWLQEQLDAGTMMVTDQLKEAVANKALALICQGRLDGDPDNRFGKLAAFYECRADYLASCLTLQLDTNGDGYPDVTIDLSCTDTLFA